MSQGEQLSTSIDELSQELARHAALLGKIANQLTTLRQYLPKESLTSECQPSVPDPSQHATDHKAEPASDSPESANTNQNVGDLGSGLGTEASVGEENANVAKEGAHSQSSSINTVVPSEEDTTESTIILRQESPGDDQVYHAPEDGRDGFVSQQPQLLQAEEERPGRMLPDFFVGWRQRTRPDGSTYWYHLAFQTSVEQKPTAVEWARQVPYELSHPGFPLERLRTHKCEWEVEQSELQARIGGLWTLPSDRRLDLKFQKPFLTLFRSWAAAAAYLKYLKGYNFELGEPFRAFFVKDYDDNGMAAMYHDLNDRTAQSTVNERFSVPSAVFRDIAPWRRIVLCQGISRFRLEQGHLESQPFPPFFFGRYRKSSTISLTPSRSDARFAPKALDLHIKCEMRNSPVIYEDAWVPFHVVWYNIRENKYYVDQPDFIGPNHWQHVSFWADGPDNDEILEKCSFTMQPYPARIRGYRKPTSEAVNYWTLLILSPPCFYTGKWRKLFTQVWSLQETMLDRVQELFEHLVECWANIVHRFDQLIIEHDRVFHPEVHTRLTSDDLTFSLSRKYAWAISCFLAFDASIEDAVRQWDEWNAVWIEPCLQSDEFTRHQDLDSKVETVKGTVTKLRNIQYQIQELSKRTTSLRDGILTATSVIEARAAARLGENVRLLTYLNIIYLPLMCSAAFFALTSRDNYFDPGNLPWVTLMISISTYFVMVNVDRIAYVLSWRPPVPGMYEMFIMTRMRNDPDSKWRQLAALLDARPAHRTDANVSVSSWTMHRYFLLRCWNEMMRNRLQHDTNRVLFGADEGKLSWKWLTAKMHKLMGFLLGKSRRSPSAKALGKRFNADIQDDNEELEMPEIDHQMPAAAHVHGEN